jgi:DNA-binding MarR family transcriptional regulator
MTRPSLDDATALRAWRDQTLYRLLLRASRVETTTTLVALQARGYDDVSIADTNLLANLDTGGATITALARRAGVTRQAASQQVAALERAGYVERQSSPDDGRAVIVVQTARGRALLGEALDIVDDLETSYTSEIGPQAVAALKRSLRTFLDRVDPQGVLGPD